jgi:hypothetical protein
MGAFLTAFFVAVVIATAVAPCCPDFSLLANVVRISPRSICSVSTASHLRFGFPRPTSANTADPLWPAFSQAAPDFADSSSYQALHHSNVFATTRDSTSSFIFYLR